MGCLGALIGLAMAGGGGYLWFTTGNFLWAGVVCIIGILILLGYMVALSKGAAIGGLDDIGDVFGSFD